MGFVRILEDVSRRRKCAAVGLDDFRMNRMNRIVRPYESNESINRSFSIPNLLKLNFVGITTFLIGSRIKEVLL